MMIRAKNSPQATPSIFIHLDEDKNSEDLFSLIIFFGTFLGYKLMEAEEKHMFRVKLGVRILTAQRK